MRRLDRELFENALDFVFRPDWFYRSSTTSGLDYIRTLRISLHFFFCFVFVTVFDTILCYHFPTAIWHVLFTVIYGHFMWVFFSKGTLFYD